MPLPDVLVLLFLLAGAAASAARKKLTIPAAVTGALLGALIYKGSGFMGLSLLAAFFLLGTTATSWKKQEKLTIKGAAAHQTTRHAGQVLANAGVAAILSGLAIAIPAQRSLFLLMMAAAFSSAMSDTLSSELGMVYGRRFFNILTRKADEKGLDGVISIEGLLFGIAGSALIAVLYTLFTPHGGRSFVLILISGTFGNLADSLLGATFERGGLLSNDGVNFLNTLLAALCAGALTLL
jgi:uncharacterized protein (TIGR00297 family)